MIFFIVKVNGKGNCLGLHTLWCNFAPASDSLLCGSTGCIPCSPKLTAHLLCCTLALADDLGPRDQHQHVHRAAVDHPHGQPAAVAQAGPGAAAARHAHAAVGGQLGCAIGMLL